MNGRMAIPTEALGFFPASGLWHQVVVSRVDVGPLTKRANFLGSHFLSEGTPNLVYLSRVAMP